MPATIKISDVELFVIEVPSGGTPAHLRALLARVLTNEGFEGWGECPLPNWNSETLRSKHEAMTPLLVGRSLFDVEDLLTLDCFAEAPALRSAVEMGCWDAIAQACQQPLCHLLGGVYRERIPLAVRLPTQKPETLPHQARTWAEKGFHAQIINSTGQIRWDLAMVKSARESAGDRARIRLDGQGKYTYEQARDLCNRMEQEPLQFFLDPIRDTNFRYLSKLYREINVPLAVSQSILSPKDVMCLAQTGISAQVVINIHQVGGLLAAKQCAAVAKAGGLDTLLGGTSPFGIATAAFLHLAASTPGFASSHECSYHLLKEDILEEPFQVVDGNLPVPNNPGLGILVDRDKVEGYMIYQWD